MSAAKHNEDSVKKLAGLIKGIKVVMLTTVAEDGSLHSRPMVTQQVEFDGALWFITRGEAPKVGEVCHDRHVNVSYASPDDHRYVSVSGTAEVVRDAQKVRELWSPALRAWFPSGPDDPGLALLRVDEVHKTLSGQIDVFHLGGEVEEVIDDEHEDDEAADQHGAGGV